MVFQREKRHYLKVKAAYLYYMQDITQVEIAKMLDISRPTLIKMLKEAKAEGIVRIEIADPRNQYKLIEQEEQLKAKLNIKEVKVVEVRGHNPELTNFLISEVAAEYISETLKSNTKVGVGWGKTIEQVAKNMGDNKLTTNIEFIPLLGGPVSNTDYSQFSNSLCEKFASNFKGCSVAYMYAPAIANDEHLADAFMQSENVKEVLAKLNNLDVAIVGVDSDLIHSTTIELEKLDKAKLEELENLGVAGNICTRFYDSEGRECKTALDKSAIGISFEQIKNTPLVIAVAGGIHKVNSIVSAAKGGLYHALITDSITAENIIIAT